MSEPRIILYDIETIPNLQMALENWVDLVPPFPGKKPTMSAAVTSMCSFGYMVLGEEPVGLNAWDFPDWETNVNDDKKLCIAAREILNSADAVVTFNGKRFDEKYIQTRLSIHDLPLLNTKIPHIDLCKIASRNLFLLNNRLKTVAKFLLQDDKMTHDGWPLWVKVHGGVFPQRVRCLESEAVMSRYNIKDVVLMKPLFQKLRPVIPNIPNHNLYQVGAGGLNVCPDCGSSRLNSNGIRATSTRTYRRYCCMDCGSWSKTDVNDRLPRKI